MSTIGFEQHDHSNCIQGGLKAVEESCSVRGLQFTPVRKRVMELLLEGHRAMGAYEILNVLRDEGLGSQPPVAYRALDFLVSSGFAHRIERLNAFAACMHPGEDHTAAFLICRSCDAVAEAYADPAKGLLGGAAQQTGFEVETAVIEAMGLCPNCQTSQSI